MLRTYVVIIMVLIGQLTYAAHKSNDKANEQNKSLQGVVPRKRSDQEPVHATDWAKSEKELRAFKKERLSDYVELIERVRKAKNEPVVFAGEKDDSLLASLNEYDTALKYAINDEELREMGKKQQEELKEIGLQSQDGSKMLTVQYHDIPLKDKKRYKKKPQLSYAWKLRLQLETAKKDHTADDFSNPASAKSCSASKK